MLPLSLCISGNIYELYMYFDQKIHVQLKVREITLDSIKTKLKNNEPKAE